MEAGQHGVGFYVEDEVICPGLHHFVRHLRNLRHVRNRRHRFGRLCCLGVPKAHLDLVPLGRHDLLAVGLDPLFRPYRSCRRLQLRRRESFH